MSMRSATWKAALAALALLLAAGPAAAADGRFLRGVDDLPLMPGLTENADAGMEFDAPGGRFVEAVASGAVSAEAVRAFYAATLPQLGWTRTAEGHYAREDERLRLDVSPAAGGGVTVRFVIEPADRGPPKP